MNYDEDLDFDKMEFECCLRENIFKTKEFQELYPDFSGDLTYSKEEQEALDIFKRENEEMYNKLKVEIEVDFALLTLERRCHIETYKRLNLPFAKEYWEKEDLISVCSDKDLITLIDLMERIRLKSDKDLIMLLDLIKKYDRKRGENTRVMF